MSGIARERRLQEIGETEAIGGKGIEFRIIPESEVKDVKKRRG